MTTMLKPRAPRTGTVNVTTFHRGKANEIEIDFDELRRKEAVKIGNDCSDLYTQAAYYLDRINEIHSDMLRETSKHDFGDMIEAQIDAIADCVCAEMDGVRELCSKDWVFDFTAKINSLAAVAKHMVNTHLNDQRLITFERRLNLAQNGVLL